MARLVFLLICLALPSSLRAHTEGESYLDLEAYPDRITGTVDVFVEELERKTRLDLQANGQPSEALVQANSASLIRYIGRGLRIDADGAPVDLAFGPPRIVESERDGRTRYLLEFPFEGAVETPPVELAIELDMLFEGDPFHRTILILSYNYLTGIRYGEVNEVKLFSRYSKSQTLDLGNPQKTILNSKEMIPQGILHIWIGADHILFLLALLLPTVLAQSGSRWVPVERFPSACWNTVKIVTLFTLAHSITLALAAFDFISLPGRLVEAVIALSIVLVALNNIFPVVRGGSSLIVLALGLFHGLGFASVMGELPFRVVENKLIKGVIGFNIGVELGQVAIVILVFPLLYAIREHSLYLPLVLKGGSAALALVGAVWFAQRAFGL